MVRIPTHRVPTHPGQVLREEFLEAMDLTQRELADSIAVPNQRVNEIVNGRRGVTPSTALRLSQFFGTSIDFWINLQFRWDLYHARESESEVLKTIPRYKSKRRDSAPLLTYCPNDLSHEGTTA